MHEMAKEEMKDSVFFFKKRIDPLLSQVQVYKMQIHLKNLKTSLSLLSSYWTTRFILPWSHDYHMYYNWNDTKISMPL